MITFYSLLKAFLYNRIDLQSFVYLGSTLFSKSELRLPTIVVNVWQIGNRLFRSLEEIFDSESIWRYFLRFAEAGGQGSSLDEVFISGGIDVREVYNSVLHPNDIIINRP